MLRCALAMTETVCFDSTMKWFASAPLSKRCTLSGVGRCILSGVEGCIPKIRLILALSKLMESILKPVDQCLFLFPAPTLNLLLPIESLVNTGKLFKINQLNR